MTNEKLLLSLLPDGAELYEVGGGVRDDIFGVTPKDHDYLVTGITEGDLLIACLGAGLRVDHVGASFGVFKIRMPDGEVLDVALPRTEQSFGPGHTDFDVDAGAHVTLEEDMARRDFTCNAIARNVRTAEIIDVYGGEMDIHRGHLNFVGSPDERIKEDPLRILRGYRLMAKYDMWARHETLAAFRKSQNNQRLTTLSKERIAGEFMRILDEARDHETLESTLYAMLNWGALEYIFPFFHDAAHFDQRNKYHDRNLADHLIDTACEVKRLGGDTVTVLAALLHDCGKIGTQTIDENGQAHYLGHEELGANLAGASLDALKFSRADVETVEKLTLHHMRLSPRHELSDKALRRFVNDLGVLYPQSLILRTADIETHAQGMHPDDVKPEAWLAAMMERCDEAAKGGAVVKEATLAITGDDIMEITDLKPGKAVGELKKHLTALVVEGQVPNEREVLLKMVSALMI
jgi:tRNA nucleotidyltransferase/poly(A) polymerase